MASPQETVLVAMSGGVDSSVAAALLLEQGCSVIGVFMSNGVKAAPGRAHRQGCCSVDDARDARRVADRLGVPFYALNLQDGFEELMEQFAAAYVAGRTPNPCIECNRRFKMGVLLDLARKLGASSVATGHYARIRKRGGRWALERAADGEKDQSYVLFPLDQTTLARTRFPLADLTKAQVREEARRFGLRVADKPESMEICFVPTGDYRDVIRERRPDGLRPGAIVDGAGRRVGEHGGTALFTVGQRRGLPGGQDHALYVTALEPLTATVTVGSADELLSRSCTAGDVVWSGTEPPAPGAVWEGRVKIRHRHPGAAARVTALVGGRVGITFERPQAAVTPGQAAVLYDGDRVLLGGWIDEAGAEV